MSQIKKNEKVSAVQKAKKSLMAPDYSYCKLYVFVILKEAMRDSSKLNIRVTYLSSVSVQYLSSRSLFMLATYTTNQYHL